MTGIKELALRVAKEVVLPAKHITFANEIGYGFDGDELADFAKRFLAAYLAEQEPVAWIDDEGTLTFRHNWMAKKGTKLFTAPPEPAPHQEPVAWAREWEGDVSDIGNMIIEWNKEDCDDNPNWFPLFTAPPLPEHTPQRSAHLMSGLGLATETAPPLLKPVPPLLKPAPHEQKPIAWTGCGECDCDFPCYEGGTRCIRLSPIPELVPYEGKEMIVELKAAAETAMGLNAALEIHPQVLLKLIAAGEKR